MPDIDRLAAMDAQMNEPRVSTLIACDDCRRGYRAREMVLLAPERRLCSDCAGRRITALERELRKYAPESALLR